MKTLTAAEDTLRTSGEDKDTPISTQRRPTGLWDLALMSLGQTERHVMPGSNRRLMQLMMAALAAVSDGSTAQQQQSEAAEVLRCS